MLLTFVGGGSSVTAGADDDCPDILVLGMRGSGEPAEGDDGIGRTTVKFWQEFRPRVPTGRTVELWANPYPAVAAIGSYPWQVDTDFDAVASQARLGRYRGSIAIGERLLRNELDERAGCANTRFVLTGYSQGGQVAADVYAELPPALADKVVGMALFGDPTFNSASRSAEGSYGPSPGSKPFGGDHTAERTPSRQPTYCSWHALCGGRSRHDHR